MQFRKKKTFQLIFIILQVFRVEMKMVIITHYHILMFFVFFFSIYFFKKVELQAQILTPIPSTGFMYNPHMGKDSNLTCFEVFCLFSIGAFTSNTALRNCFFLFWETISENTSQTRASLLG